MLTLAYDSECGPCTRFRRAVEFLDAGRAMKYVGLEHAEGVGLLDRVPQDRRRASFHLVAPDGRAWSGAGALSTLASQLPCGAVASKAIESCPLVSGTLSFAYRALSRLHGSGSCAARPTDLHV